MTDRRKKAGVLICYGTRPEVIKVASTIEELSRRSVPFKTVFTGQHDELYHDVRHLIPKPDYRLGIMKVGQSPAEVLERVAHHLRPVIRNMRPNLVVVQGDTSSSSSSALTSFYERVSVGHIEAGLRTYNLDSPFPEEMNRQLISKVASLNWAPTELALENLEKEGARNVRLTGNTVVDICQRFGFPVSYSDKVLITLHRRENFGEKMASIFSQIERLAQDNAHLKFVFPMHPNPQVQRHRDLLEKVTVLDPLKYEDLLRLLSEVKFVISDSGGIQEECAAFRKKVLVCRDNTERPEGVEAGLAKLVGSDIEGSFAWADDSPEWSGDNPYGDGKAGKRIVDSIESLLQEG
ncbi:MAG: UDP-N-acetylglucosamine 2-epimerase (non-hydrolyzing) [Candidatus Marinimicrobia bacterium]|nr:UDP-N-acetylglucosamine 2-epimerase (non-hydrolyzing) [Candidatus Neomarinimicrobiota bacterium]MDP6593309.1 UDP-N-acetylglucosamine 2-epimerase (non-hydrolyzing) [Candidatus Neomarinimicrobiota bacterium]MDP6966910.1 UDP-N-acetylglucosamine 2-epimerase (non-hydrolyzing) [Candidatus Neomarinimicrobiota bacterium]